MQFFHPETSLVINRIVATLFTDVEAQPHFRKLIKAYAGCDQIGETLNDMVSVVEKEFSGTNLFENGFTYGHGSETTSIKINNHYVRIWITTHEDVIQIRVRLQNHAWRYSSDVIRDVFVADEIPRPAWIPETFRAGIMKALFFCYQDHRCVCSNLLKAPGMCDSCKTALNKVPCAICKGHRGRMAFKKLKRGQPKQLYHEMCKRRKL